MTMTFRQRFGAVLLADLTCLRWTMGWIAVVLGFGFLFAEVTTPNYIAFLSPAWMWGILFLAYGLCHVAGAMYRLKTWVSYLCGGFGMWLWNYLFLSFVVFDKTPIQATEMMLALPIVCEVWLLAEDIYRAKTACRTCER
jgi:hypothetical protein